MEENLKKKREIELHKQLASAYHNKRYGYDFSKLFNSYWNERILEEIPKDHGQIVLECGCGTGTLFEELNKFYSTVFGIDISYDMLKLVPSESSAKKVIGDMENLAFPSVLFDIAICRGSLHHVENRKKALKEIHRVLKPGGLLIISEPSNDFLPIRIARRLMYRISNGFDEADVAFLNAQLEELTMDCGYSIEKKEKFGYLAYLMAGFPDHLPIMKYLPFRMILTRFLIYLDRIFSTVPYIKETGFHIIMLLKKIEQ